eukprot:gene16586-18221_t
MKDFVHNGMVGDVRIIDTDYCCCRFGDTEHWLPCCAVDPLEEDAEAGGVEGAGSGGPRRYALAAGGFADGACEGLSVVLRPEACALQAASPFTWHPSLRRAAAAADPGTLVALRRGVDAVARVQFGGYFWSLPLRALQANAVSPRRRGSLVVER